MRERNISDVFLDMSIWDFPGLQHDFNESQKNGRGTKWPADIPIPFEEFKKILEKQLNLPVELPTISPISTNPDIFPQYTSIFEKIERINANNNIARICQAKYLLSESPRQYELSKDLIFNLKMFEWDGTLDIDCLNKLTEDCIAIHLYVNEEPGEREMFWFVFRDLLQQMPILVVVMAMAPDKGKDTWYLCVYEIPLAPGRIRDNIRYRDVRRIRSRYPITTPADTDVISERITSVTSNLLVNAETSSAASWGQMIPHAMQIAALNSDEINRKRTLYQMVTNTQSIEEALTQFKDMFFELPSYCIVKGEDKAIFQTALQSLIETMKSSDDLEMHAEYYDTIFYNEDYMYLEHWLIHPKTGMLTVFSTKPLMEKPNS